MSGAVTEQEPTAKTEDETNPVDLALDLFVYAPLGALLEFSDRLPELARRGRERFESQAPAAKMVGQFAVSTGRKKIEGQVGDVVAKGREILQDLGVIEAPPSDDDQPAEQHQTPDEHAQQDPAAEGTIADVIEGYAEMTAVKIMPMLSSLTRPQRNVVRAFELGNRARRTVLARLDQLEEADTESI